MNLPSPEVLDVDFLTHDSPNFQKWMNVLSGLFSPTSYKVAGWLTCMSAAMQRRYWLGTLEQNPITPNTYTVLVGASAAGKGLVLSAIRDLLSSQKQTRGGKERQVIVSGPDDTTYEALINAISKAIRVTDIDPPYAYSAMYLCLQEVESMFKKFAEKLCLFLISGWDADKYAYETKNSGTFWLQNISVTICAGGVTKYVKELTYTRLMSDGFVGRTMFVFDSNPSSSEFFIAPLTSHQIHQKRELEEHIKYITTHAGAFKIGEDTREYITAYWKDKIFAKAIDENNKLNAFYGRYREHIPKLAMCFQISDSHDFLISRQSVDKAIHFLEHVTILMQKGFSVENPVDRRSTTPANKKANPELDNLILTELAKSNGAGTTWINLYTAFGRGHKIQPSVVQEAVHGLVQAGQVRISGVRVHLVASES